MNDTDNGWRRISETKITAEGMDHFLYLWIRGTDQAARVTTGPVHTEQEFANLHGALGHLLSWTMAIGTIHAVNADRQARQ